MRTAWLSFFLLGCVAASSPCDQCGEPCPNRTAERCASAAQQCVASECSSTGGGSGGTVPGASAGGESIGGSGTGGGSGSTGGGIGSTGGGSNSTAGGSTVIADVSAPAFPCTETKAAVVAASAPSSHALGARVACSFERTVSAAEVMTQTPSAPASPSAVDLFLLAYRTTRRGNVPGTSLARVYLPKTPKPGPLPVIALGHPSVGVADTCAVTNEPNGMFGFALPWASRGYAVIAPDFAGLGNAGTQGYVDNHDTARSMLDAVRALRAFVPAGAIDGRAVLIGYSQGGGAVLAAQTFERSYGSGGRLSAVVAIAPEFFTRLNSFGYVTMLRNPNALTVAQGYTKPVIAALRHYAFFDNTLGVGHGVEAFPAATAIGTVSAIESQCLIALGGWLPANRTRVRDLIDDALRVSFLACVDGPTDPTCQGAGKQLYDGLVADVMTGDPGGAPVLYLQGVLDTVMPLAEEAACNVPAMRAAGVPLTYCSDALAAHSNISDRNVELVRTWVEATLEGRPPPSCSSGALPACPP